VKKMMMSTLILFLIFASGCSNSSKSPFVGQAKIDWVDFIKMNGHSYEGIYTGTLSEPSLVGREIGTVKFRVSENVTNPNYKTKDGDAAFLEKGTKIYEVKGNPNLLAVKDEDEIGGYRVYYRDRGSYNYHFKNLNQNEVEKIQIYEEHFDDTQPKHQLLSTISDLSQIKNFLHLLNQGSENDDFRQDATLPGQRTFIMIFYTNKAVAFRSYLFYNGKEYGWAPWSQEVLPDLIGEYLNPQQVN
jgi:hypothetical protein